VKSDKSDYVELRCRSAFSFLEAASNPEDLVARAAELDYPALALADCGGLYGTPRFHQAARDAGLRALVGAELRIAREAPDPHDPGAAASDALLLLVETPRGYRNLSRLITCGHARGGKEAAIATWEELEAHAGDLTALARGDAALAPALLDRARAHPNVTMLENHCAVDLITAGKLGRSGEDRALGAYVLDAETGERKWKGGRYNYGSLLLVQGHLLVLSEEGELVLVEATPDAYREIGRVQILNDKTWNNHVLVGGILFARNHREMVCYDLRSGAARR